MKFNYKEYFKKIKPKNVMGIYNRALFTFCSIHTNWNNNIKGYLLLKDKYHTDEKALRKIITNSGLGLTNNRTRGILEFTKKYIAKPNWYKKRIYESWNKYEARLKKDIFFLGPAKTAFLLN